jgi:hypothetical protein
MVLFVLIGCDGDRGGEIPRERFVQIYRQILVGAELHRNDTTAYRLSLDSLMTREHVTRDQLQRTMQWYSARPAELDSVLREIDRSLEPPRPDSLSRH